MFCVCGVWSFRDSDGARMIQKECAGKGIFLSTDFPEHGPGSVARVASSKHPWHQCFVLSNAFIRCVTTKVMQLRNVSFPIVQTCVVHQMLHRLLN